MTASHQHAWIAHVMSGLVLAGLATTIVVPAVTRPVTAEDLSDLPFLATLALTLLVGWLLSWRRPRNPLGWLLVAYVAVFAAQVPVQVLAESIASSAPTASAWLYWLVGDASWIVPVGILLSQIPLRFPDGRLPSPRWRSFWWFTVAAIVFSAALLSTAPATVAPGVANPAYIPGMSSLLWVQLVVFGSLAMAFGGSIVSLFVRYRRAGEVARAQLRWMLWAVAVAVALLVGSWLLMALGVAVGDLAGGAFISVAYGLIPVSIAFAVLRYRLYEIDRIISRTASYAIVTVLLGAVYALVVTSVTWILPAAPAVAVALATLAAAAVFLPALRWIRRGVDRRFDREQYDAQRVVDAFGERVRTGADPQTAAADLVSAVERTLQPTSVGVWTADS